MDILLRILSYLSLRRKKQLAFLMFLMIFSGLSELISLYSVFPLMLYISEKNPEDRISNLSGSFNIFSNIISNIGLGYFSLIFIFIIIFTTFIRIFNIYINYKLAAKIAVDICDLALRKVLNQDYLFFVKKNSAEIISTLIIKSNMAVFSISLFFQCLTGFIVSFAIIFALFAINFKVSLLLGFLFSTIYLFISFYSFKTLQNNGRIIASRSDEKIKIIQESVGGIRDLILDSNQYIFRKIYRNADADVRNREANNQVIAFIPRYTIEGLAIILLIAVLVLNTRFNPTQTTGVIALAGTLALGTQRLLPSMQLVYGSWATIQSQKKGVIEILDLLALNDDSRDKSFAEIKTLPLKKSVKLKNISYRFDNDHLILNDINLTINKGEKIGIIGKTGSGKSTLLDIFMGLLFPQDGSIYLDNIEISKDNENYLAWRKSISHVPQSIFLADASIAENIAFGIKSSQIDMNKVKEAAIAANLLSFINSKKNKFDTYIGERGIQLSGGQRQRIGIARALYKGGDILVLDEATSALDSKTESSIMQSVMKLSDKKTIVIVAHRLSTLIKCDKIYELKDSRLEERNKEIIL